ncbi:MAG: hypothetical protein HFJ40_04385 [Clostridia bacterium]|nr:hypothetical protein [Clostridia bacterium]
MNNKVTSKIISGALLCTMIAYTAPVFAFTKDETVYSKLNINGSSYSTIVNSHIENKEQAEIINDISDLLNIENVNTDEVPSQNGNNLVWNAEGSDIYYQGESQKELPIECNIKYELDGKEISAKELAGKNGKVKITIEYTNKDAHITNINGKDETLYTPFVVVCGTILDNEHHKNVEITNGKVVDDGSKTTVIGISLPGMQESLNISKDKLEVPNTIEITMDATEFELSNIVTYVTPKVIEENDLGVFDKIDEIYSKVDTLQSSSNQIEEGANTLKEGTDTYSEKSKEFNNAMNKVANGVNSASQNYSKIDNGISTLDDSSNTLNSGVSSLKQGTETVLNSVSTVSSNLDKLEKGSEAIKNGVVSINAGLTNLINGKQSENNGYTTLKATLEQNEALLSKLVNEYKIPETDETVVGLRKTIAGQKQIIGQMKAGGEQVEAGLESMQSQVNNKEQGLVSGTTALNSGLNQLNAGIKQMEQKLPELSNGINQLSEGTQKLSAGTKELNKGSKEMKKGLNTLDLGSSQLLNANNQLVEGASTISQGTTTLAEGISKFNKEGIKTICNYINGDIKDITARLKKLQELSEEYNNFTMLNNGDNGNVKFIMIIDSIKKEEDSKEEIIIDNKNEERE